MKGLSFLAGGEFYVADVTSIQKVMRKMAVTPVPSAPDAIVGISNLGGKVITVLDLGEILGHGGKPGAARVFYDVDAIVFKSFSGGEDQMCLLIDEPGDIIEINENAARMPSLTSGAAGDFCISGVAEVDNRLYRIIKIESILEKFKDSSDKTVETTQDGGIENGE